MKKNGKFPPRVPLAGKSYVWPEEKSMPSSRNSTRRSPARRRSRAYRASKTIVKITYLIAPDPALKRLVEATPSGMAHWSGTGPPGTVCEPCRFYGYGMQYPNSCYRYFLLTRQHGAAFPVETPSCQHFQPRNMGL